MANFNCISLLVEQLDVERLKLWKHLNDGTSKFRNGCIILIFTQGQINKKASCCLLFVYFVCVSCVEYFVDSKVAGGLLIILQQFSYCLKMFDILIYSCQIFSNCQIGLLTCPIDQIIRKEFKDLFHFDLELMYLAHLCLHSKCLDKDPAHQLCVQSERIIFITHLKRTPYVFIIYRHAHRLHIVRNHYFRMMPSSPERCALIVSARMSRSSFMHAVAS
jgi:hypothetical protein